MVVSYIGCDSVLTMVLLTLAVGFQGALYTGYLVNHLDLSPNYASVIYGITSTFGTIPSFVAPLMVATLTKGQVGTEFRFAWRVLTSFLFFSFFFLFCLLLQQTLAQWRIAFLISAGIMLFESVFYLFFGSGEEQPWNQGGESWNQQSQEGTSQYENGSLDASCHGGLKGR